MKYFLYLVRCDDTIKFVKAMSVHHARNVAKKHFPDGVGHIEYIRMDGNTDYAILQMIERKWNR